MTRLETRLVQPPSIPGEPAGATSTPIYQTATFAQDLDGENPWDYSRSGNPTRDVLEEQLAFLDGARRAFAYGSGIAAVSSVLRLLEPGDEALVGGDLYGGTQRLLSDHARTRGLTVRVLDDPSPAGVLVAIGPRTRLVLVESVSNPRLRAADVPRLAAATRPRGVWLAVDNSMLSPCLARPLELGADLAIQSATKLLGGHGDLTAGVVAVNDEALARRLAFLQNAEGTALPPFDSWLLLRGLQTLAIRVERQRANAARVLQLLRAHPAVRLVHGPPPPAPPAGVVLSFETGSVAVSRHLVAQTRLFRTTVSFGGVTSSISLPCAMSHASVPAQTRKATGLEEDLVRLSMGIEAAEDLVADLEQAFGSAPPIAVPRGATDRRTASER